MVERKKGTADASLSAVCDGIGSLLIDQPVLYPLFFAPAVGFVFCLFVRRLRRALFFFKIFRRLRRALFFYDFSAPAAGSCFFKFYRRLRRALVFQNLAAPAAG